VVRRIPRRAAARGDQPKWRARRRGLPHRGGGDGETRERAFDDLVAWIERGVRPDGDDVLARDLSRVGLKWTRTLYPEDPLFRRE